MTDAPENSAADNDAKRKFREALARKGRGGASREAREDSRLRAKGGSNPAGGKRQFRRKTG
ncbi:DUF5302 domain-containing protein [Streptomyces sp. NPDC054863]